MKTRSMTPLRRYPPWTVLCIVMASGCAVGPDFVPPAPPDAQRYTHESLPNATDSADGKAQHFMPGTELVANWWTLFKSEPLNAAVNQALAHNPTLQASLASLRQSQDLLRAGQGAYSPRVDAGLSAERAQSAPTPQAPTTVFNLVTASVNVSYALDVFGGERRAVEGLSAQVEAQRFLSAAAYLTISANVVNACIARAAYFAQVHATEELIGLETEQLRTLEVQVNSGTTPYANLLSQRSLIAGNLALLAPLKQKISQLDHLLGLLQGLRPDQIAPPDIAMDTLVLPTDIPLSLPSALVRQRPDILSAEALLHVASANIGVATAAQYPSFSLNASYGSAGTSFGNAFGPEGRFWSIGPSLLAPLLNGGTLEAQKQSAVHAYEVQQANYRQTVLAAFAQVADALNALEHDAQTLQAQVIARDAANEALHLLQVNLRSGLVAYVDVLSADVQLHLATIAYLQALAQRHQDTVALFVALGGGWSKS